MPFYDDDGNETMNRSDENDREQEVTTEAMAVSIETQGAVAGVRGEPWLKKAALVFFVFVCCCSANHMHTIVKLDVW